jgi:hypothetical protein
MVGHFAAGSTMDSGRSDIQQNIRDRWLGLLERGRTHQAIEGSLVAVRQVAGGRIPKPKAGASSAEQASWGVL